MGHRFRFIGTTAGAQLWRLAQDEAFHVAKVLRLKAGTPVEVTTGDGRWAVGVIRSVTAQEVLVDAEAEQHEPEPRQKIGLAIGALKHGVVDEILPPLTELGVDSLHIFLQEGSDKTQLAARTMTRWQRILVQSLKQCKRARLPELHGHLSAAAFVAWSQSEETCGRFVLSPQGEVSLTAALAEPRPPNVLLAIGGEKGLTNAEAACFQASGFRAVHLGPHILRATTAAVAAMAIAVAQRLQPVP